MVTHTFNLTFGGWRQGNHGLKRLMSSDISPSYKESEVKLGLYEILSQKRKVNL